MRTAYTSRQKANAEIKVKQATGEIDWDLAAIQATQNSWKDEWITLLFSIPLILAFCGDWGNNIVQAGFAALETPHGAGQSMESMGEQENVVGDSVPKLQLKEQVLAL